jgi:hypothetical protein
MAALALDRARASQLRKKSQRNAVLNDLLRVTAAHDRNYALSSDEILEELVRIAVDDCVGGWPHRDDDLLAMMSDDPDGSSSSPSSAPPVLHSRWCWTDPPTKRAAEWAEHWKTALGPQRCLMDVKKQQMLEVILVLLRNLSFVGANLRLLAYNPRVLHLLVACLYDGTDPSSGSDDGATVAGAASTTLLAHSALHALVNLSPYLDVSGQRLCSDRLFYKPSEASEEGPKVPGSQAFGQAVGGHWGWGGLWLAKRLDTKEDTMGDVSREFVLGLAGDHLVAVWSVFPALAHVLTNPQSPRSVILMGLDLLQELVNTARVGMVGGVNLADDPNTIPSLRQILVSMPDSLLNRLVDLLYVPRLGPDSLEYVDPVRNVVTRVTTLKLLTGYDAAVDAEVRDRILELLVPLMELDSPRMAARIGRRGRTVRTKLFDSAIPILITNAGRQEAPVWAIQFFRELNMAPENRVGFLYAQERLVELASRDARVSSLVFNHLYVPHPDDDEEEEETLSVNEDEERSSALDSDEQAEGEEDESGTE